MTRQVCWRSPHRCGVTTGGTPTCRLKGVLNVLADRTRRVLRHRRLPGPRSQQILCDGHAPGEQVFHRCHADVRVKRSKKAERDRQPSARVGPQSTNARADYASVVSRARYGHRLTRAEAPEARPHLAFPYASMSSTSTRRVSTRSRPDRRSLASSPTRRTSIESRSIPRTCTTDGSSETSSVESGVSKANHPPSHRTSGRPPRCHDGRHPGPLT